MAAVGDGMKTFSSTQQGVIDDMNVGNCYLLISVLMGISQRDRGWACALFRDGERVCKISMATFDALMRKGALVFYSERRSRRKYVLDHTNHEVKP